MQPEPTNNARWRKNVVVWSRLARYLNISQVYSAKVWGTASNWNAPAKLEKTLQGRGACGTSAPNTMKKIDIVWPRLPSDLDISQKKKLLCESMRHSIQPERSGQAWDDHQSVVTCFVAPEPIARPKKIYSLISLGGAFEHRLSYFSHNQKYPRHPYSYSWSPRTSPMRGFLIIKIQPDFHIRLFLATHFQSRGY